MQTCSIVDCGKPVKARGWCDAHYMRWQRHGDPLAARAYRQLGMSLQDVFDREIDRSVPNGKCLEAVCTTANDGYPRVGYNGKSVKLSRVAVALKENLPLGGDWKALHSCDNRACINPKCLRSGTTQDNADDMVSRGRQKPAGKSGYRGVYQCGNKWVARIYVGGKQRQLGTFETPEEASHYLASKAA